MSIKSLITTLLIFTISTLLYLFYPRHASVLHYKGQAITITRNDYSIPYIIAPSRPSFFYAIGRVHAQDRLFQTIFKILVIQGRLSEYLGEKPLPMDKFMRELNLNGWGKQAAERLQKQNQTQYFNFEAYVDGINEYADSLAVLPFDFQLIRYRWQNVTVGDIFGIFKLLEWSQSMNIGDQYFRSLLLANYTKQEVYKYLPITKQGWAFQSTVTIDDQLIPEELTTEYLKGDKRFKQFEPQIVKHYTQLGLFDLLKTVEGSNVWAISGEHTKSRKPILVHDPHLQNVMPSQWYQLQATYAHNGKNHSISGISTSGFPFIIGQTDYLALGVTTIYMDNQDLYRQTIKGNQYLVNDKWIDLKVREEKIKVKTAEGIRQDSYIIRQTHRGPLINYIIGSFGSFQLQEHISLRWTGFNDEYSSVVLTTHIAEVDNIEHVKTYLLNQTEYLFNVNVVFITTDGHIGHQQLGRYPIRRDPSSAHFVKDGKTTENDWLGFVPPYHRLQTIDPAKGFIANGNNKLAGEVYYNDLHKYTIYTSRSDRIHFLIEELIKKGHKLDVQDAKRIISDTVDSYCQRILPYIIKSVPQSSEALQKFDCNFVKESSPAAMYEVFIFELHHLIKPHQLSKASILSMHTNAQYLFNFIKEAASDSSKEEKLVIAWENMKANLNNFFKSNDSKQWSWGKYHKDVMHHLPFSNSPLAFLYDRQFQGYGNLHTVNVGKMNKVEFGNFQTSHRANYRAIYSFVEGSFWIIDSGNSEKWFSKHYDDQWKLFQQNKFIPLINPSSIDLSNDL